MWPLSSLMTLRDIDHMKNGEGLSTTNSNVEQHISMRERVFNILHERTHGKVDLRSTINSSDKREKRKILLVTHLMYYGYCFNPVSFFFVLKPNTSSNEEEYELEAIVVEVSNTPWDEMSIYVLHPESVDVIQHFVYPLSNTSNERSSFSAKSPTHRYRWRKNFHVSPFMPMDFDYDWKFLVENDRVKVEAKMIKQKDEGPDTTTPKNGGSADDGVLFFTAGFDIHRTLKQTSSYPLQLAKVILRFPIYCFIIQLWIHYEAIKLLMKGVQFIPHPEGSETNASKAIAAVMRPVFAAMDVVDSWLKGGEEKSKSA